MIVGTVIRGDLKHLLQAVFFKKTGWVGAFLGHTRLRCCVPFEGWWHLKPETQNLAFHYIPFGETTSNV